MTTVQERAPATFTNTVDLQGMCTVRACKIQNVNAAKTLTAADCGIIILGAAVGTEQAAATGFQVKLPTPAAGLHFKFILRPPSIANNSNAAITVLATSDGATAANIAVGMVEGTGDDQGANVVAGVDLLTFVHAKATCGDHATYVCDGTNWFVTAKYDVDAAITLA
jgi:hypothetical protein